MTSDIKARVWQHREEVVEGFTKRYAIKRLVFVEWFESIELAIVREKQLKKWSRAWKIRLIEESNPTWRDLYEEIAVP